MRLNYIKLEIGAPFGANGSLLRYSVDVPHIPIKVVCIPYEFEPYVNGLASIFACSSNAGFSKPLNNDQIMFSGNADLSLHVRPPSGAIPSEIACGVTAQAPGTYQYYLLYYDAVS